MYIISIEGIDGTGKTTLLNRIKEQIGNLREKNIAYIKFPTNNFYEKYKELDKKGKLSDRKIEKLQDEDKKKEIKRLKDDNMQFVFCDRAELTQKVYNGTKKPSIKSDAIIYLDVTLEEALSRIGKRGKEDNLGYENMQTLKELQRKYKEEIKDKYYNQRTVIRDVSKQEYTDEFVDGVIEEVFEKLELKNGINCKRVENK